MNVKYPYLPPNRTISYVSPQNKFLKEARKVKNKKGCSGHPTGAVVVKNKRIIGRGSNAGKKVPICPRLQQGFKTGKGWHLCKKICLQEGHAEAMAVKNAQKNNKNIKGADLYLDGHWWCCKPCWNAMIKAGIKNVYLHQDSKKLYRR